MSSPTPSLRAATSHRFERRVLRSLFEGPALRVVFIATAVEAGFVLLTPWLSGQALDTALPEQAPHLLLALGLLVVATAGHAAAVSFLRDRLLVTLQQRCEAQCLEHLMEQVLGTDFQVAQQRTFGDVQESMRAASEVCRGLCALVLGGTTQLSSAAAILAVLAHAFPPVGAGAVLAVLLAVTLCGALAHQEAHWARARLAASSAQQQWIHVLLAGILEVRAAGASERLLEGWRRLIRRQTLAAVAEHDRRGQRRVLLEALPRIATVLALVWLVARALDGAATLGDVVMATLLCSSFFLSVSSVIHASIGFRALEPQRARADLLLDQGTRIERRAALDHELDEARGIELDQVWFRYDEAGHWVLENRTQTFPAGELSVLQARSGSGKSTLLRLVAGLIRPARGTVRVFGLDPARTSGLVSYLPQRTMLLKGTIATNLTTLSGAPLEASLRIAHLTGLHALIRALPLGLGTPVHGPQGGLSAGQRQIVLLTALFASGRPVVLIDEGLAQVDETRSRQVDWGKLVRGRTVLLVSHE